LESFDPQKIGRYTVFRAHYEYRDQPPGEKLFVALKHGTYGFDALLLVHQSYVSSAKI
jgi:hypothetical protein